MPSSPVAEITSPSSTSWSTPNQSENRRDCFLPLDSKRSSTPTPPTPKNRVTTTSWRLTVGTRWSPSAVLTRALLRLTSAKWIVSPSAFSNSRCSAERNPDRPISSPSRSSCPSSNQALNFLFTSRPSSRRMVPVTATPLPPRNTLVTVTLLSSAIAIKSSPSRFSSVSACPSPP